MIKILHTSDWHLGKNLHGFDLLNDQKVFIEKLIEIIKIRKIDVLLHAGDVFDVSNPSQEALNVYYDFLAALNQLNVKVIITAGNHDNPNLIDAPANLIFRFNIHCIGTIDDFDRMIIPVQNKNNETEAVVLAVPFLKESFFKIHQYQQSFDEKFDAYQKEVINLYQSLAEKAEQLYPNIPKITTGHLHILGTEISDAERDIVIGNQQGLNESIFNHQFDYVALGHIHLPQKISSTQNIYYSGSPYHLSFSEINYPHQVIEVVLENKQLSIDKIKLPNQRKFIALKGSFEELKKKLSELVIEGTNEALADIHIVSEHYRPEIILEKNNWYKDLLSLKIKVIHDQYTVTNTDNSSMNKVVNTKEITPIELAKQYLEDQPNKEDLLLLFKKLVSEVEK